MSELPVIPEAPEMGDSAPFSYHIYAYQPELKELERWLREIENYTNEPHDERMRKFVVHPESSMEPPRLVQMVEDVWQMIERKAKAYDRMRYAFSRLLFFTEGQQQALQEQWHREKK